MSSLGVYIQWNGMVEWNGGMLHRTYLTSMCCTVNSTHHWKISEFVVVADRSTLSQLSLCTTYVYGINSGSRLVPWTTSSNNYYLPADIKMTVRNAKIYTALYRHATSKQDLESFTSTVTYHVSRLCGQVSVHRCYTFP